jgi:hypothetical protein
MVASAVLDKKQVTTAQKHQAKKPNSGGGK